MKDLDFSNEFLIFLGMKGLISLDMLSACIRCMGLRLCLIIACLLVCGAAGPLAAQNHLLLSEIVLQPADAEFIEIYNPTTTTVSLDNYYLSDNQAYPYVPGSLPVLDMGDFVVRFPAGASIKSNETLTVAVKGNLFEAYYGRKAGFEIYNGDANTPDMVIVSEKTATLANAGEGIALFFWDGSAAVVKDVDLMNAGVPAASAVIVDKTGIAGYLPDAHTIPVQGHNGPPLAGFSTKRILPEGQKEIHSGGNGLTGDDETSEDISVTWDDTFTEPNPGITTLTVNGTGPVPDAGYRVMVYPNPAKTEVNLIFEPGNRVYSVQLLNSLGAVVLSVPDARPAGGSLKINLSGYERGAYFIRIQSDLGSTTQKIILLKGSL